MSAIPITISGFKPLQGLSGSAFGQFLSRLAGKLRKEQLKGERHRKALTLFTSPEQGLSFIGQAAATCDIAPFQSSGLRLSHWAIRLVQFVDLRGVISMRLSQFLQQICALTPLQIAIPEEQDAWLESPIALLNIRMYSRISDVITNACKAVGLSERGLASLGCSLQNFAPQR
jgi:hypothetical protein